MTAPLVTDHAWRPPASRIRTRTDGPVEDRPCEYMNCRRTRAEHERSVRGWGK